MRKGFFFRQVSDQILLVENSDQILLVVENLEKEQLIPHDFTVEAFLRNLPTLSCCTSSSSSARSTFCFVFFYCKMKYLFRTRTCSLSFLYHRVKFYLVWVVCVVTFGCIVSFGCKVLLFCLPLHFALMVLHTHATNTKPAPIFFIPSSKDWFSFPMFSELMY